MREELDVLVDPPQVLARTERDHSIRVERVLSDVQERFVSRAQAEAVYGVIITGSPARDDLAVDISATTKLRESRLAASV